MGVLGRRLVFGVTVGCGLIALLALLLELGLRVLFAPQLERQEFDSYPQQLWAADESIGWDNAPSTRASISDGYFSGHVTIDEHSLRLNAPETTYREGDSNLLFVGDGTAVSLEVDDDETIPARLEQGLRARGARWNVVNLGVRGYGTDQSVDKAIREAKRLGAREAIYLFVPNDVYETNVAKAWGHLYSKPVHLWNPVAGSFGRLPPMEAPPNSGRLAVLDDACSQYLYESSTDTPPQREADSWLSASYLYRAWWRFVWAPKVERDHAAIDPHEQIRNGVGWSHGFISAYLDQGVLRQRCAEFFERQMRFHLERLRAEAGLDKVHVVHFPHARVLEMGPPGTSPNVRMFESLLGTGVIDSYLDLNAVVADTVQPLGNLLCPSDPHFCAAGNAWAAERILEHVTP